MKHTPGPWTALGPTILGANDTKVASISMGDGRLGHVSLHRLPPEIEAKANQSLILAVPELLAALYQAQGIVENGKVAYHFRNERGEAAHYDKIVRKIRTTIANAIQQGE